MIHGRGVHEISLSLLPMVKSIGVVPLTVTCVFFFVAALRINWAAVIWDRVVLSRFFEPASTGAERNFSNNRNSHLGSIWPRCVWSSWTSLHIDYSMECLHIMWMMESHVCTNRLRIHLKRVHPFMEFRNDFCWRGTLSRICCQMWCRSIQKKSKSKVCCRQFWLIHDPRK